MAFIRRMVGFCLLVGLAAVIGAVAMPVGWSQVGYSLYPSSTQASGADIPPSQPPLSITAINETRTENSIVLYTDDFGTSTRTNALGTEVVATLAPSPPGVPINPNGGQTYVVKAVISQADCEKSGQASLCGNASIPKSGIVLSATGLAQKALLGQLTVGQTFELVPRWFQTRTQFVDAVNPTPETNPRGKTYPGLRASQQLLIYDQGYGQPTTGTNEFGFEVTVNNGLVTAQEGANSTIPTSGFVLSAHGKNRDWLVENAPMGAQITVEDVTDKPYPKKITSAVTPSTYRYRLLKGVQAADPLLPAKDLAVYQAKLGQVDVLMQDGKDIQAAQLANQTLEDLNHHLWAALPGFDAAAVRGVWHRPVETTASAIGQTLDALKAAGINAVFLETYYHGMTIFPSETMAAYGLPSQYPNTLALTN
jgi:hypothetical protein